MKDIDSATNAKDQDELLLSRLLKHDKKAVREFYLLYSQALLNFIRRKIGNECDVEEIAQDTLFAFLEGARDFTGKCKLRTYLCSIAQHKIVDFYRKKKLKKIVFSQLPQGLEMLISQSVGPEELFDNQLLRGKIKNIFNRLAPRYSRILRLKYVEGRGVDEIAKLLSCSFKSAESVLFRARKTFVRLYLEGNT